ncbi:tail fiber protein, partial [Pectobacterium sp. A113-S21-F16]
VNLAAGALPKNGGVMSGGVRLGGNLDLPLERRIAGVFPDNTYREMLWLASDNSIQVGDVKSEIAIRTKGSLNILINDKWHQGYHTGFKPTAADIGAVTKTDADNHYVRQGSSGVVYQEGDLVWNSPTGAYLKDNGTYSSLIWHMGLNTGSASSAQFYFDFANGGIKYRSSRDHHGFEKPWARIYTDQDKPTAAEIGALSLSEIVGIPMPWPQATAPSGWLKCNGQAFDKNIYPLLAQAYPSGILPDLRGEFVRGWDDGRQIDKGRGLLTLQQATIVGVGDPNISATALVSLYNNVDNNLSTIASNLNGEIPVKINDDAVKVLSGAGRFDPATASQASMYVRPRNIAFNYIVRSA